MLETALQLSAAFQQHLLLYGSFCVLIAGALACRRELWAYWTFFYACFLKPVDRGNAADVKALSGQQRALEGFYRTQAEVYDATRALLLCGREDMLQLAAAQLKHRQSGQESKPIWVDVSASYIGCCRHFISLQVGGGTGYNIEKMNDVIPVNDFFSAVYLVDLSPSLCEVARQRFARLGWNNVHVVCEDARTFVLDNSANILETAELGEPILSKHRIKADFISMSYSLSMIPEYAHLPFLHDEHARSRRVQLLLSDRLHCRPARPKRSHYLHRLLRPVGGELLPSQLHWGTSFTTRQRVFAPFLA